MKLRARSQGKAKISKRGNTTVKSHTAVYQIPQPHFSSLLLPALSSYPCLKYLFTQLFHIQVKIKGVGYYYLVVSLELTETQKDLLCLWSYGIKGGVAQSLPAWEPGTPSVN